ncbi:hypothetical protein Esti_005466 [Eimeria stiedai]
MQRQPHSLYPLVCYQLIAFPFRFFRLLLLSLLRTSEGEASLPYNLRAPEQRQFHFSALANQQQRQQQQQQHRQLEEQLQLEADSSSSRSSRSALTTARPAGVFATPSVATGSAAAAATATFKVCSSIAAAATAAAAILAAAYSISSTERQHQQHQQQHGGLAAPRRAVAAAAIGEAAAAVDASEVVCFLTQADSLPPNQGLGIYFALPPYAEWEVMTPNPSPAADAAAAAGACVQHSGLPKFIGVLTNRLPSVLLSTGWHLLPAAQQAASIRLGFLLEPAESLTEKLETKPPKDAKKEYARKVALNLYRFVESHGGGDQALLDRWFERFEAKYRVDPNFVMKSE